MLRVQAVQQLAGAQQEMEMLSAVAAMPEAERRRAAQSSAPPPAVLQQLRSAAEGLQSQRQTIRDNLLRPSHNLPTRTLAQQVGQNSQLQRAEMWKHMSIACTLHRSSHDYLVSLTLSVFRRCSVMQYDLSDAISVGCCYAQAKIEMQQAQEAAQRQQEAEAARAAKGSDDEDDDEAVHRQRAMDDWKVGGAARPAKSLAFCARLPVPVGTAVCPSLQEKLPLLSAVAACNSRALGQPPFGVLRMIGIESTVCAWGYLMHLTHAVMALTLICCALHVCWVCLPSSGRVVRFTGCAVLLLQDTHPTGWGNSKLRPTA